MITRLFFSLLLIAFCSSISFSMHPPSTPKPMVPCLTPTPPANKNIFTRLARIGQFCIDGICTITGATPPSQNFFKVSDICYRSRQLTYEELLECIETKGIETIINLRGTNPKTTWYKDEVKVCCQNGVRLVTIEYAGAHTLLAPEQLARLIDAINEPGVQLIHCKQGQDRTSLAVALKVIEEWRTLQDRGHEIETRLEDALAHAAFVPFGHVSLLYPRVHKLITCWHEWRIVQKLRVDEALARYTELVENGSF
jgi:hypothetical protein